MLVIIKASVNRGPSATSGNSSSEIESVNTSAFVGTDFLRQTARYLLTLRPRALVLPAACFCGADAIVRV
jgi:hypothetical protein